MKAWKTMNIILVKNGKFKKSAFPEYVKKFCVNDNFPR